MVVEGVFPSNMMCIVVASCKNGGVRVENFSEIRFDIRNREAVSGVDRENCEIEVVV